MQSPSPRPTKPQIAVAADLNSRYNPPQPAAASPLSFRLIFQLEKRLWAALTTFLAAVLCSQSSVAAPILTSSEIRRILIERVDEQHRGVRIVVGVIEPDGRRVVAHGRLGVGDERAVNGDAIFEIGSITKLFTELLLADMVERGGKSITLAHLANHTSGLPRMPDNWNPHDPDDPYADYDSELLFQFLSNHKLRRDPGSKREYSNAGFAILGELLAHRAGSSYGDLLVDRICMPLGTSDTTLTVSPKAEGLLATGHDMALEPTARHHPQALTAGGALHSTVNDLLTFLAANLGYMQPASERSVAALRAWGERVKQRERSLFDGWPHPGIQFVHRFLTRVPPWSGRALQHERSRY